MSQFFLQAPGGGGSGLTELTPNSGGPVAEVAGNINILGVGAINTTNGGAGTLNINFTGSAIVCVKTTLTSSQIKNLSTTPITLIAAQGASTVIAPISAYIKFVYGGNSVFTNLPSVLNIAYNSNINTQVLSAPAQNFMDQTSNQAYYQLGFTSLVMGTAPTDFENQPITIFNSSSNITGNPENDNTLEIVVCYATMSV